VQPLAILEPRKQKTDKGAQVMLVRDVEVVLPLAVDLEAERERLRKDREVLEARIAALRARLDDEAFLSRAPAAIVEKERAKLTDAQARLEKVGRRLAELR